MCTYWPKARFISFHFVFACSLQCEAHIHLYPLCSAGTLCVIHHKEEEGVNMMGREGSSPHNRYLPKIAVRGLALIGKRSESPGPRLGGGPRVVVSTAAFQARVRFPVSAVWKKQKCFFPIHMWKSVLWGASVTERWRARPQTARAQISNPVSGGQCHLNHFTILRRFSWPSLAYMCTKVA